MKSTPTAQDLNGTEPIQSAMDIYLDGYGTVGLTLLVQRALDNAAKGKYNSNAEREVRIAFSKLEAALNEAADKRRDLTPQSKSDA